MPAQLMLRKKKLIFYQFAQFSHIAFRQSSETYLNNSYSFRRDFISKKKNV